MHKKTLIIIDAYNFLFRAFYAMPTLTNNKGIPVGAVYGFINMIFKYITNPPDYMVIACDTGKKTFRDLIYPEYKMNRGEAPEDLCIQFPLFEESIEAFNLSSISKDGYEADDIIATLATNFASSDLEIIILSSDKDLIQLMSEKVKIFDPIKEKIISEEEVIKKFGIKSSEILDFLSLTGDSSDNIPGVRGIGPVTAAKLINEFKTLENLLLNIENLKKSKIKENLINFKEHAIISKQLLTLDRTVELKKTLEDLKVKPLDSEKVLQFLRENDFKSILQRTEKIFSTKLPILEVSNDPVEKSITNIEEFMEITKEAGIISVEQNNEEISLMATIDNLKDSKLNFIPHKQLYVVFKFNITEITQQIRDLFADKSILKITNVMHNFLHRVTINSWHCINTMLHTLNSSNSEKYYDTSILIRLYFTLIKDLFKKKLFSVYFKIEKPIIPIIIAMEKRGVMISQDILQSLSLELKDSIIAVEKEIFSITGYEFNIASTKQLAEALFEQMKIPYPAKDKKHSTDVQIMESLEECGYVIATKILQWRSLNKLKITYADGLMKHVNKGTSRVHTTYSTIGTNTGRLSSSNPNLQNIPRNKKIKCAFIAKKDHYLISADYSQIELRIIAHLANIINFKKILTENGDIHLFTASQIFPKNHITDDLRQKAKAINFGIIYGITPFGLAKQLKISVVEAKQYIDIYFSQYPEIKEYMEITKQFAKENGYVVTKFGRKCNINEINSKNFVLRGLAERSAINAPIQGTASDIIKKAIIKIAETDLSDYLIMQIHDEVILEVPKEKLNETADLLSAIMVNVDKDLYLKVDINFGENLADLKPIS